MIATALAFVALSQQAGTGITAIYSNEPTWKLTYPEGISAEIQAYYTCLRNGSYTIGTDTTFEVQYRKDVARCVKKRTAFEFDANAKLEQLGLDEAIPADEVAIYFQQMEAMHLARGASLDSAVRTSLSRSEGHSLTGKCAADVQTLVDQRASYMDAEALRIEALTSQQRHTPEEQAALDRYRAQLTRYNELITLERGRCAAAGTQETGTTDAED